MFSSKNINPPFKPPKCCHNPENYLQPMLEAIAGETCAGLNSTSAQVIIIIMIVMVIIIMTTTTIRTATTIILMANIMFQPMLAATIAVDPCAGLNSTIPEVRIIIVIIISINDLVVLIIISIIS